MSYEEICECNNVGVLKHFIRVESQKCDYKDKREEMITWISLPDQAFIDKVRDFEKQRTDDNPIFGWTIGTEKNPTRWQEVKRWILAKIKLESLYTCGMNSKINVHLDLPDVKGNLKSFVLKPHAHEHKEICTDSVPTDKELTTFIRFVHHTAGRDDEIEVLDGNHRAMAMLANGCEHAKAYIAELW